MIRGAIENNLHKIFRKCRQQNLDVTVVSILSTFFESIDLISEEWKLGSILSVRFFGKLNPVDREGARFISKLRDFIAALCVIDHFELTKTVIELFHSVSGNAEDFTTIGEWKTHLPLSNVAKMLRAMYGAKCRKVCDSEINKHIKNLIDFIFVNKIPNDKDIMISKDAVITFFGKIHPNALWPLKYFQSKLRTSFLSNTFIERVRIYRPRSKKEHNNFNIVGMVDALNECSHIDTGVAEDLYRSKKAKRENALDRFLNFLVVEDSVVQRKIITKKLKVIGGHHAATFEDRWHFKEVNSGEDAIMLLGQDSNDLLEPCYDVVIVDENLLGEMKGHEIVKNLKSRQNYDCTVVVGCSMNLKKNAPIMYSAGADLVWGKPIPEESTLIAQLEGLLISRGNRYVECKQSLVGAGRENFVTKQTSYPSVSIKTFKNWRLDGFCSCDRTIAGSCACVS